MENKLKYISTFSFSRTKRTRGEEYGNKIKVYDRLLLFERVWYSWYRYCCDICVNVTKC